jgi:hypothetical protein
MAVTTAPAVPQPNAVRRFLARGPAAAATQLLLVLGLFVLYRQGRLLAGDEVQRALHNGSNLWNLERTLHLPSEETLQDLVIGDRAIVRGANWYYVGAHFPVTIAFLVLLYARARRQYGRVRNALALATGLGLAIHIFYPLAPPRLIDGIGMVDTGSVIGPSPYQGAVQSAANQFAAMPSLHVGWAVMVAIVTWRLAPRPLRAIGWVHAALTTIVVVVTANHYWIDIFVGTALVLVALRITRPRRRSSSSLPDPPPVTDRAGPAAVVGTAV